MSWIRELSLRGKDPDDVRDATEHLEFEIPTDPRFVKGCVIGDPCMCSGAKAISELPNVVWVWLGAHMAVVEFEKGDMRRYQHNGVVPRTQDKLLMPPPGHYRLSPPRPSMRRASERDHHDRTGQRTGARPNTGRRVSTTLSTAGLLRR